MTCTSYLRGHKVISYDKKISESLFEGQPWVYCDTGEPVEKERRPCKKCKKNSTPEGYDPCLGFIKGAKAACCGHGFQRPFLNYPYILWEDNVTLLQKIKWEIKLRLTTTRLFYDFMVLIGMKARLKK